MNYHRCSSIHTTGDGRMLYRTAVYLVCGYLLNSHAIPHAYEYLSYRGLLSYSSAAV